MLLHIDTDFGGDPDDACALAMLLGDDDVEIAAITTCLERDGRRAGCVQHYLDLADRANIPVAAGAEASLTTGERFESTWGDSRYWPTEVRPKPSPRTAAQDLLAHSIRRGATVVAIGSFTNLAELEIAQPGALHDAEIVAMAGWLDSPGDGWPDWGPEFDFNVQCDPRAASIVIDVARVTFVTLPVAMRAQLQRAELPRLRASGPIGALLARQSETYALDTGKAELGVAHARLADDLENFHWDPVAAAVAAGWPGASIDHVGIETRYDDGTLDIRRSEEGRQHRVVVDIDAPQFTERWLGRVEAADRAAATRRAAGAR